MAATVTYLSNRPKPAMWRSSVSASHGGQQTVFETGVRCDVPLTGVQALGDRGGFDQVTSTQVAGDEVVEVSHQVLPSCGSHIWTVFSVSLKGNFRRPFTAAIDLISILTGREGLETATHVPAFTQTLCCSQCY